MTRDEAKRALCEFLDTVSASEVPMLQEDEEVPFDESGLVDSVAMLQIVTFLEDEFGIDLSETGIDTETFGSVARILDLVESRQT